MLGLLLVSCGVRPASPAIWQGPQSLAPVRSEAWHYPLPRAGVVVTKHYRLHTDLPGEAQRRAAAQLLEGAWSQYGELAGTIPLSPSPMNGYLFANRSAWSDFTRANTGEDAAIYLQVSRGAYTVNDWFAAYWLGEGVSWSVLSHEGWHQFVARQFAGRLPPALEEGMACLFENVGWQGGLPRWNLGSNPTRQQGLRLAKERRLLLPLGELLRLHAGEMVGQKADRVQAFYSQNWAFARYLLEGDGGRYRPGLERLLAATAAGRAWLPPHLARPHPRAWNASLAGPVMEHYLGAKLADLEPGFGRFVRRILSESEPR